MDENIIGYAQAGQIVSTQSYVLFHVCLEDSTCYIDAEDDRYMVPLSTYLANIATYHANKRSDFCEQCERNDEYCNPEEEEEEAEDGASMMNNTEEMVRNVLTNPCNPFQLISKKMRLKRRTTKKPRKKATRRTTKKVTKASVS